MRLVTARGTLSLALARSLLRCVQLPHCVVSHLLLHIVPQSGASPLHIVRNTVCHLCHRLPNDAHALLNVRATHGNVDSHMLNCIANERKHAFTFCLTESRTYGSCTDVCRAVVTGFSALLDANLHDGWFLRILQIFVGGLVEFAVNIAQQNLHSPLDLLWLSSFVGIRVFGANLVLEAQFLVLSDLLPIAQAILEHTTK
mmetsp:Transcript_2445/g.9205  ORF Transcript_2445/g.9205 Transcript_2445/m.9205 type:complete len:200 (+) Transcript_2445:666-1265(+)